MHGKSKEIQSSGAGSFRFRDFELNPTERSLTRRGEAVALQPKVFDALLLLASNADRLVRKEELMDELWPDAFVSEANLTNIIVALRKTLGRHAIQTVPKHGYRFKLSIEGRPGVSADAFASFSRACQLVREKSIESMQEARELYWVCLAHEPRFADAWASLGRCCRFLHKFGAESPATLELAEAAFRRALAIDPDLPSAHRFYTQLQADGGEAQRAAARLLDRAVRRPHEAECFAGLVHVLRYCGLVDESLFAHELAVSLDPAVITSVPHTFFLRCEYAATIESYHGGTGYYLDAAAWAALGESNQATELLRRRLESFRLSPLISGLMQSLLAVLEGRNDEAVERMRAMCVSREPEVLFYLARHYGRLGRPDAAVDLLQQAREEGYFALAALVDDPWLECVRRSPEHDRLRAETEASVHAARQDLDRAGKLAAALRR